MLEQFKQYKNIQELTRSTVVNLIDNIRIHASNDIDVALMHGDRFASIVAFLKEEQTRQTQQAAQPVKGVI